MEVNRRMAGFRWFAAAAAMAFGTFAEEGPLPAGPGNKPGPANAEWGAFRQVSLKMGNLIRLKWEGGALRLDRAPWDRTVMLGGGGPESILFNFLDGPIRKAAYLFWAMNEGLPAGGGNPGAMNYTSAGGLDGRFWLCGKIVNYMFRGKGIHLMFREEGGAERALDVYDDGAGMFCLSLTCPTGERDLWFRQAADGSFRLAFFEGDGAPQVHAGDSFRTFCRAHADFVCRELFPLLNQIGIPTPDLPNGKEGEAASPKTGPASPAGSGGNAGEPAPPAGKPEGAFEAHAPLLRDLCGLKWHGKTLRLDRPSLLKDVEPPFHRLAGAVCGRPGIKAGGNKGRMPDGSLHADLNFRLADAGGDPIGLMGYLALRGDKWIRLTFQEPASPMRLVDILDDGSGAFRLAVADPRGKAELLFNQGRDGRFHLAWFSEGKWTAWSGKSFLSAYRAHAAFVDGTLFPALERLGFRVPWTRQDPKVIAAVCARLRPLSKQEQAEFDGLFRKMSSGDLAVRGEAVRDLSARYDLFRGAIANVLESPDTPLDVVSHLEEAIKREHPEPAAVSGWLFDSGLLEDPGYLMEILERVEGEPDRQAIGKRLARLTGKKSGTGLR